MIHWQYCTTWINSIIMTSSIYDISICAPWARTYEPLSFRAPIEPNPRIRFDANRLNRDKFGFWWFNVFRGVGLLHLGTENAKLTSRLFVYICITSWITDAASPCTLVDQSQVQTGQEKSFLFIAFQIGTAPGHERPYKVKLLGWLG